MPWSTRKATSSGNVALTAQASEDRVKRTIADRNTFRAPHRAAIHPLTGMNTASVTM